VTEILTKIQSLDDVNVDERMALFTELRSLIRSLGHRVDRATRDQMLRMLTSVEGKWRPLVGEALGYLQGDVETAKALMGMLQQRPTNVYTRSAILSALGKMQVKEVLPDLVATLGAGYDSEPLIVRAIGQIGGPEASAALLDRLDTPLDRDTAAEIERVIGQAANPVVMEEIKRRLKDASPKSRASMMDILAMTGDAAHAAAVRDMLATETDAAARRSAILALGRFGDPASGDALLRLLEGGSETDRQDAARAMERVRQPETIQRLAESYANMGEPARLAVLLAGSRVPAPGATLVEVAKQAIRDPVERIRMPCARILGQRGRDEHVEILADYMKRAESYRERAAALQALRQVGTPKAAETALSLLDLLPERQREPQRAVFEKMREVR
jgi:HEAT repeat protein